MTITISEHTLKGVAVVLSALAVIALMCVVSKVSYNNGLNDGRRMERKRANVEIAELENKVQSLECEGKGWNEVESYIGYKKLEAKK